MSRQDWHLPSQQLKQMHLNLSLWPVALQAPWRLGVMPYSSQGCVQAHDVARYYILLIMLIDKY